MVAGRMREIVDFLLNRQEAFTSVELARAAGVSRQAIHRHLVELIASEELVKEGQARATRYRRPRPGYNRRHRLEGLQEDVVWAEARRAIPELSHPAAANADAILAYATTELVNNAIDHSGSADVAVDLSVRGDSIQLHVSDSGVGVFENVRAKLHLPDLLTALQEISKGKISTAPERHSGEGLFFTSKMADRFELTANGLSWVVDNVRSDYAIASAPTLPGTAAKFEVALDKRTSPEETFARYTHDFEFDTTRTVIKLFQHGVRFVSRSEAKRLLAGLERFKEVILDFAGVEGVGQGFVDEVFRVWGKSHSTVRLRAENMAPPVAFMVERGRRDAAR